MSDREFDYYTPDELNAERSLLSELALANVRMRAIIARASVRMSDRDALDHLADMMRTRITPGADPYVPEDVRRWRNPKHRAALTELARAHAAIVPGNRATMPKEAER